MGEALLCKLKGIYDPCFSRKNKEIHLVLFIDDLLTLLCLNKTVKEKNNRIKMDEVYKHAEDIENIGQMLSRIGEPKYKKKDSFEMNEEECEDQYTRESPKG